MNHRRSSTRSRAVAHKPGASAVETNPVKRILIGVTVEESIQLLAGIPETLVANGWDVHVVSSPGERLNGLQSMAGVSIHPVKMRRNPAPFADLISLVLWIRLIRKVRPNVSFVGTPKAGLLGATASWLGRVPTRIYVLRGLRLESAQGPLGRVLWLLERLTCSASTEVVANSTSLLDRAVELKIVGSRPISVIGSGSSRGVNLARFNFDAARPGARRSARNVLGVKTDDFVVGFVGRVRTDKGVRELARAVGSLDDKDSCRLVLIGRSEEHEIVRDLSEFGRPGFMLHVDHIEDVENYYPAFDVLCLPSYREGFPNVVLEAAALGVPAVVTDATGVRDAVVHDETGLVVPLGDIGALADALDRMRDPDLASRLGHGARVRAVKEFDQEVVLANLVEHLSSALQ